MIAVKLPKTVTAAIVPPAIAKGTLWKALTRGHRRSITAVAYTLVTASKAAATANKRMAPGDQSPASATNTVASMKTAVTPSTTG